MSASKSLYLRASCEGFLLMDGKDILLYLVYGV